MRAAVLKGRTPHLSPGFPLQFPRRRRLDGPVRKGIAAAVASNIVKITVDDEAARSALTQAQVQNGGYVFQTDTATLYEVIDQTLLNGASGDVALATVTAAQISDATVAGRVLLTAADVFAQLMALGGGTAPTGTGPLVLAISPTFTGTTHRGRNPREADRDHRRRGETGEAAVAGGGAG